MKPINSIIIAMIALTNMTNCKKKCTDLIQKEAKASVITPSFIDKWDVIGKTTLSDSLQGVDFINAKIGYVCGIHGKIFKTINGGNSFLELNTFNSKKLYVISFIDSLRGFAAGDNSILLKTTDGGDSWNSIIISPDIQNYRYIKFQDSLIGYLTGSGTIFKTVDAGNTWNEIDYDGNQNIYDITFIDKDIGYICGYDLFHSKSFFKKTIDGGLSWQEYKITDASQLVSTMDFINKDTGFVVLNDQDNTSKIFKTINGGINWIEVNNAPSNVYTKIKFANSKTGYAVGGNVHLNKGSILKTIDGGNSWISININTSRLYSIKIVDIENVYACGFDSTFLKEGK